MDSQELRGKLIAAAKANPPSGTAPYAFEKRIMAHLLAQPQLDVLAVWTRMLWRAAAPSLGISLVMAAWVFLSADTGTLSDSSNTADIESAMLAQFDNSGDTW